MAFRRGSDEYLVPGAHQEGPIRAPLALQQSAEQGQCGVDRVVMQLNKQVPLQHKICPGALADLLGNNS
ncbi:Uncharacterised protein [Mycobacteroides abscessus subsp. massiliense]|nr:Uncharacterised protein [Mycobacteroides abscessus subsp. massiliense]